MPHTPPTRTYTLSLHDALPIFDRSAERVDLFNYFGVGRLEPGVEIGAVDADLARALAASGDELGVARLVETLEDRKSTRLNSSHVKISYAVFCLKKNNMDIKRT